MTAINSQSLLDISIQELGSVLCVFDLAVENDLSITDFLVSGQSISRPKSLFEDKKTAAYFSGKGLKIATVSSGEFVPNIPFNITIDRVTQTARKNTCIAISNQSLLDIAIQELGTVKAVFEMAIANNISLTEKIKPGQNIVIPIAKNYNKEVNDYFRFKGRKIATRTIEQNFYEYLFPNLFPLSL